MTSLYKIIFKCICNIFEKYVLKYLEFKHRFITAMKVVKKYIFIFIFNFLINNLEYYIVNFFIQYLFYFILLI